MKRNVRSSNHEEQNYDKQHFNILFVDVCVYAWIYDVCMYDAIQIFIHDCESKNLNDSINIRFILMRTHAD